MGEGAGGKEEEKVFEEAEVEFVAFEGVDVDWRVLKSCEGECGEKVVKILWIDTSPSGTPSFISEESSFGVIAKSRLFER